MRFERKKPFLKSRVELSEKEDRFATWLLFLPDLLIFLSFLLILLLGWLMERFAQV